MARSIILGIALTSLNVSIIWLIRLVVGAVDLKTALHEKGSAALIDSGSTADPAASSSRIVAFVTAVVLVGFLWGTSNYVIYAAFFEMEKVPVFLNSISGLLLSGSTPFSLYAVNKVTGAVN